jgi:hypothetical protein
MYTNVSIENLRGITRLEAQGLRRINLIVGRNNCGKSTFLEGLFLIGAATDPLLTHTLGLLRGQQWTSAAPDVIWRPLFHNLEPKTPIRFKWDWPGELLARNLEISAACDPQAPNGTGKATLQGIGSGSTRQDFPISSITFRYTTGDGECLETKARANPVSSTVDATSRMREDFYPTTLLSARFLRGQIEDLHRFSALVKKKQEGDVLSALRLIEPSLERVEVVSEPGGPSIYLDLGHDALVPLAVCGEGIVRLFSIIIELTASRNGVLLIDEIDNGLHYTVMPRLWQLLGELTEKYDVQIFATTHNEEIVRSALESLMREGGPLGLFRIDRRGEQHVMVSYDDEAMQAVLETHFEVRG